MEANGKDDRTVGYVQIYWRLKSVACQSWNVVCWNAVASSRLCMCSGPQVFTCKVLVCDPNASYSLLPENNRLPVVRSYISAIGNLDAAKDFPFGSGMSEIDLRSGDARSRYDDEQWLST